MFSEHLKWRSNVSLTFNSDGNEIERTVISLYNDSVKSAWEMENGDLNIWNNGFTPIFVLLQ